jgi:hypothetical protein
MQLSPFPSLYDDHDQRTKANGTNSDTLYPFLTYFVQAHLAFRLAGRPCFYCFKSNTRLTNLTQFLELKSLAIIEGISSIHYNEEDLLDDVRMTFFPFLKLSFCIQNSLPSLLSI